MKGDYTPSRPDTLWTADEDHPQMKGDYTGEHIVPGPGGDGEHP